MAHPSKRKGDKFERELVNQAEAAGVPAQRAFMSNGRALGESEGVDLVLGLQGEWRIQAKRRKSVANYLTPPEGADVTIIREDRADSLVVMPLGTFFDLITAHAQPHTDTN
jgi:Holliday junction resolvase